MTQHLEARIIGGSWQPGSGITSTFEKTGIQRNLENVSGSGNYRRGLANLWAEMLQAAANEKPRRPLNEYEHFAWLRFINICYVAFLKGPEELMKLLIPYSQEKPSEEILNSFNTVQNKYAHVIPSKFLTFIPDVIRAHLLAHPGPDAQGQITEGKLALFNDNVTNAIALSALQASDVSGAAKETKLAYMDELLHPDLEIAQTLGILFTVKKDEGAWRTLKRGIISGSVKLEVMIQGEMTVIDPKQIVSYIESKGTSDVPEGITKKKLDKWLTTQHEFAIWQNKSRIQKDGADFLRDLKIDYPAALKKIRHTGLAGSESHQFRVLTLDTTALNREEVGMAVLDIIDREVPGLAAAVLATASFPNS